MKKKIRQLEYTDERGSLEERLAEINQRRHPIALLLDGLQDIRNVGSIFRLADAANIQKVYLLNCAFDPTHKKIQRTSRSTVQYVPSEVLPNVAALEALRAEYTLVGLEITTESIPYTDFHPLKPVLLVIGNERAGISDALIQQMDTCIHLPMYGINTSMNVLCATGIAVYALIEQVKNL